LISIAIETEAHKVNKTKIVFMKHLFGFVADALVDNPFYQLMNESLFLYDETTVSLFLF
jgi:hypothetical protein